LTPLEVVQILEQSSGHSFEIDFVSEQTLARNQVAGENSWLRSVAGLRRCHADGDVVDMREIGEPFPMPMTSVRDYAARVLSMRTAGGSVRVDHWRVGPATRSRA
jgi:hypothetical protein